MFVDIYNDSTTVHFCKYPLIPETTDGRINSLMTPLLEEDNDEPPSRIQGFLTWIGSGLSNVVKRVTACVSYYFSGSYQNKSSSGNTVSELFEGLQNSQPSKSKFLNEKIQRLDVNSEDALVQLKNISLEIDVNISLFKDMIHMKLSDSQKSFLEGEIKNYYLALQKSLHNKVKEHSEQFIQKIKDEYPEITHENSEIQPERMNHYLTLLSIVGKADPESVNNIFMPTPGSTVSFTPVKGIKNIGNSCYLNATIQLLLASPEIVEKIKTHQVTRREREEEGDFEARKRILSLLHTFIDVMETGDTDLLRQVTQALRLEIFNSNLDFDFNPGAISAQQDAARLLNIVSQAIELYTPCRTIIHAWDDHLERVEPYTNFDISIESGKTFQELVNSDFSKHTVHDKWLGHTSYEKQLRIDDLPPENLVFTLKRFKWDEHGNRSKINDSVGFPEDGVIDLRVAFGSNEPVLYEVISTVNHSGGLDGGHYTSYTKRRDTWYHADDSYVGESKPNLKDAYIVLLRKI